MAWGVSSGRSIADPVHRLPPHRLAPGGDVRPRPVLVVGSVDDLVVDVRHVGHESHVQAAPPQVADQHVVLQRRPPVPDVRRPVHRRPAQVDVHLPGLAQGELADLAAGGVVEPKHSTRLERRPSPLARPSEDPAHRAGASLSFAGWPESPRSRRWTASRRAGRSSGTTPASTASTAASTATECSRSTPRLRRCRGRCTWGRSSATRSSTPSLDTSGCAATGVLSVGWDDNGLATERRVQNFYGVRCDPARPYDPGFAPPYRGDVPRGAEEVPISRPNFVALCHELTATDEAVFEGCSVASACPWTGRCCTRRSVRRAGGSARWRSSTTSPAARPTAATHRRCGTSISRRRSPRPRSRTRNAPAPTTPLPSTVRTVTC